MPSSNTFSIANTQSLDLVVFLIWFASILVDRVLLYNEPNLPAFMRVVGTLFYYVASFFIAIGDFALFVLSLSITLLQLCKHILRAGQQQLIGKFEKSFQKRHHRRQLYRFTPSLSFKVKYFLTGVLFSLLFVFFPLLIVTFLQSLPNPSTLGLQQFPQTTRIYDRNHKLLYSIYANQNRTLVPLSRIPNYLQKATIAIEDKNFYKNPGFDIVAIIRAALSDVTHQNFQGGSTITQQLIKSALLTSDISLQRKLQEVVLAFWTEHIYSKGKILEMYFNEVPYGGTAWGVEAAAETYFGISVKDLDLAQSAFLAGLPQAPTSYSPFGSHPDLWKKRQAEVLHRMLTLGYISKDEQDQALREELAFTQQQTPLLAPHFVMYIKDLLEQKYGLAAVERGGLSVTTSLDLTTQEKAQQIVSEEVGKDTSLNLSNGAAVVANPQNGDILAMVGSANYNNQSWGNVNIATSYRQPGSSIKVITYAAALSKGYTPASTIEDSPIIFPGDPPYAPVNYDGKFHGKVSLRMALANSFNIPAVKLINSIGVEEFVRMGRALGINSLEDPDHYGLSVTLGSADVTMLDMTTAYGTLANGGGRIELNPILKVTDYKGNVLEEKKEVQKTPVLDSAIAFLLSDILADNNARSWEFGPNSPLKIDGHRVSVKTGTTDNKRDNWTIGYTPDRIVTVWVGNNDNTPMSPTLASGITGAAPIWHNIMTSLLQNTQDTPLQIPETIVSKPCLGRTEYFVRGTENSVSCLIAIPPSISTPAP